MSKYKNNCSYSLCLKILPKGKSFCSKECENKADYLYQEFKDKHKELFKYTRSYLNE